jgi:hypothetical protein
VRLNNAEFEVKQSGGGISGPTKVGNLRESIWDLVDVLDESISNPEVNFDVKIKVRKVLTYSRDFKGNNKQIKRKQMAASLQFFDSFD